MRTGPNWRRSILAAILVALGLCAGCSSKPSEGDAESALQSQIKSQAKERIKLAGFKKTDGQEREMFGVKVYNLEYEAEVEFTEDCGWVTEMLTTTATFSTVDPMPKNVSELDKFWYASNPRIEMKKGQREKLTGTVVFEKSEKGWRATKVSAQRTASQSTPQHTSASQPVNPVGVPGALPSTRGIGEPEPEGEEHLPEARRILAGRVGSTTVGEIVRPAIARLRTFGGLETMQDNGVRDNDHGMMDVYGPMTDGFRAFVTKRLGRDIADPYIELTLSMERASGAVLLLNTDEPTTAGIGDLTDGQLWQLMIEFAKMNR